MDLSQRAIKERGVLPLQIAIILPKHKTGRQTDTQIHRWHNLFQYASVRNEFLKNQFSQTLLHLGD